MEPNNPANNPSPNLTPSPNPGLPGSRPSVMPPGNVRPPSQPGLSPDVTPASPVVSGDFSAPAGTPGQVVSGGFDPTAGYGPQASPGMPPAGGGAPTVPAAPAFGGANQASTPVPSSGRRSLKPFIIVLAAIVILGIGSAAAYLGVIVPNKPANVLKTALINSLQQTHSSTSGSFESSSGSSGGIAGKLTFSTQEDSIAKAADIQVNLTVSGVSFPVEARLVNKNLYVRVGDLSAIAGLVGAYSPSYASVAQSISSTVSNKWIVFDSTLLNESAGVKCFLDSSWTLKSSDINLIKQQYNQHTFAAIQSSSGDTVAGKSAEKFVLNIDKSELNNFGNGLTKLSLFKTLGQCTGSGPTTTPSTDHGKTSLTLWVDKGSKRIVKIASSAQSINGTLTINLKYDKVSITAPSGAEPAIQLLTDVENAAKSNPDLLKLLSSSGTGL